MFFLVLIIRSYLQKTFAFHFVDEEDNFILGRFVQQGDKIYKDLFSHHQPLAYLISALIQQLTNPSSVFLLIKRHREFIVAWSTLWSILLIWRFGLSMAPLVLVLELTKIFLLGNLFLAESLSLYPLVYITSLWFKKLLKKEAFFLGLNIGIVAMLLSPLWPLLVIFTCGWFFKVPRKAFLWLTGGILSIVLLTLPFISLPEYFLYSWYTNYRYYIPITVKENQVTLLLESFFAPIQTLINFSINTPTIWIFKVLSVGWLVGILYLLKERRWALAFWLFLFPGLANLRFVAPGQEEYSGFHLLPWFGVIIASLWSLEKDLLTSRSKKIFGLSFCVLLIGVTFWKTLPIHLKPSDQATDFYVHYSTPIDIGSAIQAMKADGDTLMVVPDEWLVYWQSGVKNASVMVNFYAWMNQVPYLRNSAHELFAKTPPTFLYLNRPGTGFEQYQNLYQEAIKDGANTRLFILKAKVNHLTAQQKKRLEFLRFVI